jgi:hypothetical protein
MVAGSWLVGSYEDMPAQTWSVTANAVTEDVTIPAGSYYLDDSTNSRSLVQAVATALNSHSQISDAVCLLAPDRHVFMETTATNFDVTFTDTVARNMLGFSANLSGDSSYFAPLYSRYLWVPGKRESPSEAIQGVDGYTVKDTRAGLSGLGGRVVVTHNDERTYNEFFWDCLTAARFWTTSELGGEWHEFWDTVVSAGLRFKLYRGTTESSSVDTDVGLLASDQLGPYKHRFTQGGRVAFDVQRKQALADANFRVTLPVIVVADYTA